VICVQAAGEGSSLPKRTSRIQRYKMLKFPHFFLFLWVACLPGFGYGIQNTEKYSYGHWAVKLENEENLERSLGEISAATEVQVDKLTISLENWFQNFI